MALTINPALDTTVRSIALPLRDAVDVTIRTSDPKVVCPASVKSANRTTDTVCTINSGVTGPVTISIKGTVDSYGDRTTSVPSYVGYKLLTGLSDFGDLGLKSLSGAFAGAENLSSVPSSIPATVTNIDRVFFQAKRFNSAQVSTWDVSNVTSAQALFFGALEFNQSINSWNTSKITNMSFMFSAATDTNGPLTSQMKFNQPLDRWDVSKVTNFQFMFQNAQNFNQPLATWNTSSGLSFNNMFEYAKSFNQPLNAWNVSNATNMGGMFSTAVVFNQPLNTWNVRKVTSVNRMFFGASAFRQNLSSWCLPFIASEPTTPNDFKTSATSFVPPKFGAACLAAGG